MVIGFSGSPVRYCGFPQVDRAVRPIPGTALHSYG
ncbi:hypothetical protein J2S41_005281 [Catenuloplanes atrovinosus]|uniref:Uncharacterized protein n=1 Tax=Catenuloplanes atrovinosus TaxID=137266 RepID=A0AAE4CBV3_9ACTN|nr:hypothetical protein [Catenuloplanes atrovinosus]